MSDSITRLNTALSGRYHIESEFGEGGMATVYLADDIKHERKVALKLLKPELAAPLSGHPMARLSTFRAARPSCVPQQPRTGAFRGLKSFSIARISFYRQRR